MKLKESYRYMNRLNDLYSSLNRYLRVRDFVTHTTEEHQRSKVNPDAEDEIIEQPSSVTINVTPDHVIDVLMEIIDERRRLSEAISQAKARVEIDIDHSLSMNKWLNTAIETFRQMRNIKPTESQKQTTGYKFDVEGKQTSYYYNTKISNTLAFDRDKVNELLKQVQGDCDATSTQIDAIEINTDVNFEPRWSIYDTLDSILEN